jgi:hypothetical protein
MKEVQKETKQYITIYEAIDGTEFTSKEECAKYEKSAKCVLMAKYNKLVVKSCSESGIFGCIGSEEETVNIVKLNSLSDIDIILKLIALHYPNAAKDPEWMQKKEDKLTDAYNSNSLVVIGRGYEGDCFYITTTFNEIIKTLTKISNEVN